jgi:hypothetical protein
MAALRRSTPVRSSGLNVRARLHVAVHLGRLAEQHVHGHVDGLHGGAFVGHQQLALLGRHADHRERATLALAEGLELFERLGRDGQHVALLALVAPDLLGRQARLFERHLAQVEARAAAGIVGQFGKGIRQAAGAHVVDGQDGVGRAQRPAMVDDLLRTAFDLGVAALHRIEVELGRVGAGGHRAGGAAAHADAHAGPAELDQQRAGRELDLAGLRRRRCCPGRPRS